MRNRSRYGRLLLATLAGLGAGWPNLPAAGATAGGRRTATAAVPNACRAEIARLCPWIDMTVPQGRSASICLKPFKTSLSLPCRRAVVAAFS